MLSSKSFHWTTQLLTLLLSLHVAYRPSMGIADEGMVPMSELAKINLVEKGFQIGAKELFNSDGPCLIDGICRVNTCTGSFVSSDGLILTNHHCAYEAIQNASSPTNDLLTHGFVAKDRSSEIPAPGYTVRITQGFRDISAEVLSVVEKEMPFLERTKLIDQRRKELEKDAELKNPGMRCEVAEMFTGKTYVLFYYTYLKDVRLVFAPPSSVGNFGGEVDNWEWPRHTGDFSFLRAYTAPDGSSADYSPNNVPFHPKRVLRIDETGVDEEDLVFLLGYPGRTVRHKTASFLEYERKVRLPFIVDVYAWQIATMEKQGEKDRKVAIKHSGRMKSLANVEKRSRGQILGLERSDILFKRREEEKKLQEFWNSDPQYAQKYGNLLEEIEAVYAEMTSSSPLEFELRELRTACRTLSFAFVLYEASVEQAKPDLLREPPYMDRNFDQTKKQLLLDLADLDLPTDRILLRGMLERLAKYRDDADLVSLRELLSSEQSRDAGVEKLFGSTRLNDADFVKACLLKKAEDLEVEKDSMLGLIIQLYPIYLKHRALDKKREGTLNKLYGELFDAKQAWLSKDFIPDANATLRLTYGHIRGYSPKDAVYRSPMTTLKGVMEKTTGVDPFITPKPIADHVANRMRSRFEHPKLQQVPVAILYDADTTGGNSGSPVMNRNGELIGVNFDRTFEATINDFAWNTDYSRSIGVDIRYVLFITGEIFGGGHLLTEMGIKPN